MSLQWCLQVLAKKGACPEFLARLQNLYSNNYSVVVVNNIPGAAVKNVRLTLRQGDIPSMELFSFGIDPLLCLLERVLQGILICSIPVLGPKLQHGPPPPPVELRYKVIGYADDSKPAITSMQEFTLVDKSLSLFENASGCKVHRDPASMKCKFLPLGRWRNTLEQTDIPCNYMTLADHLDMVGVTLKATWTQTRKVNGDAIQQRVDNTVKPWKAGKFMPITQRSWSLNSFALSKVWFRTRCVPLRECDFKKISSSCKSWLYQDRFAKPEETVLHRPHHYGGLALHSVKYKSMAGFITTFLQTATNPKFRQNLLHNLLFRKYVLGEDVQAAPNPPPPYLPLDMFAIIKKVKEETPLNITTMAEKDWTRLLTEDFVTMTVVSDSGQQQFTPCRAEVASPTTDWTRCWSACRQPGIPPDFASFLWLMMHDLLSTQAKLHRMGSTNSPMCKMQGCVEDGTLQHELLDCSKNDGVGQRLIHCLQQYQPGLQPGDVLRLDHGDIADDLVLPLALLTAITLSFIWKERNLGNSVRTYKVRAELEQYITLLRTTRLVTPTAMLSNMVSLMFQ